MKKKKRSQSWKDFERQVAKKLEGKRILRGDNFSESRPDIDKSEFPFLKIDCKYRQRYLHHSIFREIKRKYCKEKEDVAVMMTKEKRRKGFLVIIEDDFFVKLLSCYKLEFSGKNNDR